MGDPSPVPGQKRRDLAGPLDLAGLQATGAGVDPLRRPVHDSPDPLDVWVEPTVGPVVRMGYPLTEGRLLPTDIADGCHGAGKGSRRFRRAWLGLSRPGSLGGCDRSPSKRPRG